ncbi:MAG: hypothetical protein L3J33_00265 [Rhodobacteraceae bacterium]|nr:hypothetical protein [Paracoccaceae bacterium]
MRLLMLTITSAFILTACQQTVFVSSSGDDGRNRVVDIVNRTNAPIQQFYASKSGQRSKGQDLLMGSAIGPDGYRTLNFNDGSRTCIFDFIAEFPNGTELRRDGINVCEEVAWTVF